jgi:hypothetical protein
MRELETDRDIFRVMTKKKKAVFLRFELQREVIAELSMCASRFLDCRVVQQRGK